MGEWLCYNHIHSALLGFVTKHACDRQTDRINDSQDRASIAVSSGKNQRNVQTGAGLGA